MDERLLKTLPEDLDRFLGTFFTKKGWSSQISYDPEERRLLLELRLADGGLSTDDRFCSLVEYFVRTQRNVVRQSTGDALHFRLYGADGADLTRATPGARGALSR